MPFDTFAAKKLITSLEVHSRHPGGELMAQAALSLKEAVADSGGSMQAIRTAEGETAKARLAYDDALLEIKSLRPKAVLFDEAVALLVQISAAKKGASKLALDFITAKSLLPVAPQEPTELQP